MPIFDTHAHYDADRFDSDRDTVLSALPGDGVGLVVDPGCDLPSSRAAAELAERYPHVYAAVGIHPEDCDGFQDGDLTTPLVDDAQCAYTYTENGVTLCAIEKAWAEGKTPFRKPISCHLYPIRVMRFSNGTVGLNYHRWSVCAPARRCGARLGIPVYKALREPIVRRFGEEFYKALEAAEELIKQQ